MSAQVSSGSLVSSGADVGPLGSVLAPVFSPLDAESSLVELPAGPVVGPVISSVDGVVGADVGADVGGDVGELDVEGAADVTGATGDVAPVVGPGADELGEGPTVVGATTGDVFDTVG